MSIDERYPTFKDSWNDFENEERKCILGYISSERLDKWTINYWGRGNSTLENRIYDKISTKINRIYFNAQNFQ
jgi:hypothetical protein